MRSLLAIACLITAVFSCSGGGPADFDTLLKEIDAGNEEGVREQLRKTKDLNARSLRVPLLAAAERGNLAIVTALLDAGANPNIYRFEEGFLSAALKSGNPEVVGLAFDRSYVRPTAFAEIEASAFPPETKNSFAARALESIEQTGEISLEQYERTCRRATSQQFGEKCKHARVAWWLTPRGYVPERTFQAAYLHAASEQNTYDLFLRNGILVLESSNVFTVRDGNDDILHVPANEKANYQILIRGTVEASHLLTDDIGSVQVFAVRRLPADALKARGTEAQKSKQESKERLEDADAYARCKVAIEEGSKFEVSFPWLGDYSSERRKGSIAITGSLKIQNAYGAWLKQTFKCIYDRNSKSVTAKLPN